MSKRSYKLNFSEVIITFRAVYTTVNQIFIPSNTSNIACAILKVFCSEIDLRFAMSVSLCNLVLKIQSQRFGLFFKCESVSDKNNKFNYLQNIKDRRLNFVLLIPM